MTWASRALAPLLRQIWIWTLPCGLPVVSGWRSVLQADASVKSHHAFKVAHHGSKEAVIDGFGRNPDDAARAWVATPYNKKSGLPRFEDGEGAARLLALEPELHLSGLPVSWRSQAPMPPRMNRPEIQPALLNVSKLGVLGPARAAGRTDAPEPTECVWLVSLDDEGRSDIEHAAEPQP